MALIINKGLSISWFQKYGTGIRHLSNQVVKPIFFSNIDENVSLNYHTTHKNDQKPTTKMVILPQPRFML